MQDSLGSSLGVRRPRARETKKKEHREGTFYSKKYSSDQELCQRMNISTMDPKVGSIACPHSGEDILDNGPKN